MFFYILINKQYLKQKTITIYNRVEGMEKPKTIKILIALLIILCICIAIHINYYYIATTSNPSGEIILYLSNLHELINSIGFFITSLVMIYFVYNVKKYSWLINVIPSFILLYFYGDFSIRIMQDFVFSSHIKGTSWIYSVTIIQSLIVSTAIMTFTLIIIIVWLFKPEVKKYFNQT